MSNPIIFWMLALTALGYVQHHALAEERTIHRLIGGHKRNEPQDIKDDTLLITASAGAGREGKQQKLEEEEKKTLAQQVADGKYGLIQNELFSKPAKRPGVISYESNSDVPKDNISNLGGLHKNEIWLAENHLLVLNGGTYPPPDDKQAENAQPIWPPLDDYKAPNRQVKIPAHPKVPPPFPVQLTENGPLQILGTNSSRTLNGTIDATAFPLPPPDGFVPGSGPYFPPLYPYPPNATSGETPIPIPPFPATGPGDFNPGNGLPPPFPFPLNGTLPPYFASLPPGAAILPPPGNQTDLYDEDDPSIYYPPPYSFFYPKDNSTDVPPGPLVPGIILPPPPDFFAPLEEEKTTHKTKKITTTEPPRQIHPTTTPVPPTPNIENVPAKIPDVINEIKPVYIPPKVVTVTAVRHKTTTSTTTTTTSTTPKPLTHLKTHRTNKPHTSSERQHQHRKHPTVTILKPVKQTTLPPPVYYFENNEVSPHPFAVYGPPQKQKTVISSTQIPLKAYYSTPNDVEINSVTNEPQKQYYKPSRRPKTTTKPPAQYYFYEEDASPNSVTTPRSVEQPNLQHYYYLPAKQPNPDSALGLQQHLPEQPYYYVPANPYRGQPPPYRFVQQTKPNTFSIHVAKLKQQLQSFLTTQKPYHHTTFKHHPSPRPVYQYSFQAANYQPSQNYRTPKIQEDLQDKFRPLPKYSVQIQPAVEIIPAGVPHQNNQPLLPPPPQRPSVSYPVPVVSSERPLPSKYYNTNRPDYEYEDEVDEQEIPQKPKYVATPRPITQYAFEATPNPVYQQIYTKPDEGYFDDITRKYFTIFGKKIPGATTPSTNANSQSMKHVRQGKPPGEYQQKPISLEGDTLVNYVNPRPTPNPDAEIVPLNSPQQNKYQHVANYVRQTVPQIQDQGTRENVSYKQTVPAHSPNPHIVRAILPDRNNSPDGAFISYQLPGDDGAHFYFLTPQLAKRRDQGVGYYYSNPNTSRIRRDNKNQR